MNVLYVGVVEESARTIARELDFRRELQNLERCAKNFADDPTVYIPAAYPALSTSRVLTMGYVYGLKMSARAELLQAGRIGQTKDIFAPPPGRAAGIHAAPLALVARGAAAWKAAPEG